MKYSFLKDRLWYQANQFQVPPYDEGYKDGESNW